MDQWLADGVPRARKRQVEAHLGSCARCSSRLQALQASRRAFLQRMPTWEALHEEQGHHRVESHQAERGSARSWGFWVPLWVGAAVAAAVALTLAPHRDSGGKVRLKGGPSLSVFLKRGALVTHALEDDWVTEGDSLRFAYTSDRPVHLAILTDDARRAAVLFPLAREASLVEPGRDTPLDFSVVLDGTGPHERFFALFCQSRLELEPLRAQLEMTGTLKPPAGCQIDRIWLRKGDPAR